jgi:hypothetical protein
MVTRKNEPHLSVVGLGGSWQVQIDWGRLEMRDHQLLFALQPLTKKLMIVTTHPSTWKKVVLAHFDSN